MANLTASNYLSKMDEVYEEIEDKIEYLQEFLLEIETNLDRILNEYSDDWKYAGDAIVDPSVQDWFGNIMSINRKEYNTAYDTTLDKYKDLEDCGTQVEKVVDKLRDAKRLLEALS